MILSLSILSYLAIGFIIATILLLKNSKEKRLSDSAVADHLFNFVLFWPVMIFLGAIARLLMKYADFINNYNNK